MFGGAEASGEHTRGRVRSPNLPEHRGLSVRFSERISERRSKGALLHDRTVALRIYLPQGLPESGQRRRAFGKLAALA